MNLHRSVCVAAVAVASCWGTAAAAPAFVALEAGPGFLGTQVDGANAIVGWHFQPDFFGDGQDWDRQLLLEANLGFWRRTDGGSLRNDGTTRPDGTVNEIGLTPVIRLTWKHGTEHWFFEGGLGIHALDGRGSFADRLGSDLEFGPLLGTGMRIGPHWEIGYRIRHISNNDFAKPNAGLDFQMLRVAYHW